ncbi:hypothetical protein Trydic_g15404 [Trypoxylus dichotomus]
MQYATFENNDVKHGNGDDGIGSTQCYEYSKVVSQLKMKIEAEDQVDVCRQLLEQVNNDELLLQKIIAGDEIWIYGYNSKAKV